MESAVFNAVVDTQLDKSRALLTEKSTAYNTDGDRLAAFKVAATTQGITPKQALAGMMVKHTGSIYKMIHEDSTQPIAVWEEKIMDHINYLLNLRAIVAEEQATLSSDEALAALREKLQSEPNEVFQDHDGFISNVTFGSGVEVNHVDEEIYTNR
jgi:threonine dehydratase